MAHYNLQYLLENGKISAQQIKDISPETTASSALINGYTAFFLRDLVIYERMTFDEAIAITQHDFDASALSHGWICGLVNRDIITANQALAISKAAFERSALSLWTCFDLVCHRQMTVDEALQLNRDAFALYAARLISFQEALLENTVNFENNILPREDIQSFIKSQQRDMLRGRFFVTTNEEEEEEERDNLYRTSSIW